MSVYPRWWVITGPLAWFTTAQAQPVTPVLSALSMASPAQVSLSPANEPEVSLEALIARALQNNPQLPIARENLEAARQRANGARQLLNPTLQAVPRILGDQTAADTEIIVSQPLDLFGQRRAQAGVLAAQVRGAQAASLLAERSLIVQVKNLAADLFAAQEAENLGQSQLEVAILFRDAAAKRAAVGDVPAVQVQRADLELLRVQNELFGARAERLARRAALNGVIGQAPQTLLRVALPLASDVAAAFQVPTRAQRGVSPSFSIPAGNGTGLSAAPAAGDALDGNLPAVANNSTSLAPYSPDFAPGVRNGVDAPVLGASSQIGSDLVAQRAALLPGALQRPDIIGAQATLEAREAQVRTLGRGRFPAVELQARRGSFFGNGSSGTALRAVVTVPIFDFGSLSREKKAAQAEVRAGQAQVALLRQQAATQVEQALIRLQQQRQTVAIYRGGIVPQTLDLLRKTQIGYAAGASTYLEVLDAQRTLRAVQTEYLQALVGTRTGEAALESALGADLPASGPGALINSSGAAAPPGTAPIGTLPEGVFAPNLTPPLDSPSSQSAPPNPTNPVPAPR